MIDLSYMTIPIVALQDYTADLDTRTRNSKKAFNREAVIAVKGTI
jgi:hypothetical protein